MTNRNANWILIFDADETLSMVNGKLYDHIPELLVKLRQEGFRMWIVSFGSRVHSRECLREHNLLDLFDAISCGFHHQGKATMIQNLCIHHSVESNQCLFFDDDNSNITQVKESGVHTCLVDKRTGVTDKDVRDTLARAAEKCTFSIRTVYVGTMNYVKISAVQTVFFGFQVVGFEAQSNVSSQPIGWTETIQGAKNRLEYTKEKNPEADCWVAIENGLILPEETYDIWNDVPVVALSWRHDPSRVIIIKGAGVPVSFKGLDDLKRYGSEISKADNRACEHFTSGVVTRSELITQAVKIARYSSL
jgi:non-canonical (house-cleaning) NTP pyrophosphatase/predicted phosphatase